MTPIETIKRGQYRIDIFQDEDPDNPREWDNMGTFISWHRRYALGDEDRSRCGSVEEATADIPKGSVVLPVYIYDHGDIALSAGPFHCPWDSGQVGVIYVSPDRIRQEYGCKRITAKIRDKVRKVLEAEVNVQNDYVRGNVYGYVVTHEPTDTEVGSCWGYYGHPRESGLIAEAESEADHDRGQRTKKHLGRLKQWIMGHVGIDHREPMIPA